MVLKDNYLVIAHYHKNGLLRTDLINLIKFFSKFFNQIIFVSTNLQFKEKKKINKYVKIITRENIGYDFYSYKVGINYLKKKLKKDFFNSKKLFLLPSSLLFINPKKLMMQFKKINKFENKVYGLTKSWEICEHLQSELFVFSTNLFKKKIFDSWWNKIKKIKSKQLIIYKYEIGFSNFLKKANIDRIPLFKDNIKHFPSTKTKLIKVKIMNIFLKKNKIYKKNPVHFYWKNINKKFGIIKIELIKSNPHKVDIKNFKNIFSGKKNLKLKKEALNN